MNFRAVVIALLVLAAPAAGAQTLVERFQPGQHYLPIEPAQPTPADRIEVIEVFSYTCVHCNALEPRVRAWKATLPQDVSFRYLPASFNQASATYAAAYYAAQQLGVAERAHEAMYERLWQQQRRFGSLQEIAEFYAGFGTTAAAFVAALDSAAVRGLLERGHAETIAFQIDGTPTVVVAGRYRVTASSAGGNDRVFEVVDFLIAKERARRAAAATG